MNPHRIISFQRIETDHICCSLRVNKQHGFFLIDTGASNSCIAKIINNTLSKQGAPSIDGIIGADLLTEMKALIDYDKMELRLQL